MSHVTAGKVFRTPTRRNLIFKMIGIGLESEKILTYINGSLNPTISNVSTSWAVIYCKSENMQDFLLKFIIHLLKVFSGKDKTWPKLK